MERALSQDLLREIASIATQFPETLLSPICRDLEGIDPELDANASFAALPPIAQAHLSHRIKALIHDWKREAPGLSPSALSWSIRAAITTNEHSENAGSLELVWTGPADRPAKLRRTEQALVEVIRSASKDLWLVSFAAYYVPSIRQALMDAVGRSVKVRFVAEDPEESKGKINHSISMALGKELEASVQVLVWPNEKRETNEQGDTGLLHVKCALADDKKLFVTSANLSGHAMNLNMELGLLIDGGPTPGKLAEHLEWLTSTKHLVEVSD